MNMFELDKLMNQIDWSQVSPKFLEKAVEEYKLREEEAQDIIEQNMSSEDLERFYYGVPVAFPRKKHAYRIALKGLLAHAE